MKKTLTAIALAIVAFNVLADNPRHITHSGDVKSYQSYNNGTNFSITFDPADPPTGDTQLIVTDAPYWYGLAYSNRLVMDYFFTNGIINSLGHYDTGGNYEPASSYGEWRTYYDANGTRHDYYDSESDHLIGIISSTIIHVATAVSCAWDYALDAFAATSLLSPYPITGLCTKCNQPPLRAEYEDPEGDAFRRMLIEAGPAEWQNWTGGRSIAVSVFDDGNIRSVAYNIHVGAKPVTLEVNRFDDGMTNSKTSGQ